MEFIDKLARGFQAARDSVGSEPAGEEKAIALEHGGTVKVQSRVKRPDGRLMVRVETPLGEGLARLDLSPADARALAIELMVFANAAAALQAKPVEIKREPEA